MSDGPGVVMRESGARGWWNLRGDGDEPRFRDGVAAVVGVSPPIEPCTWHAAGDRRAYWLGPDEWLLTAEHGTEFESPLRGALHGRCSIVDVSGAQILVNLSGAQAGEVLRKSSPYDFHPRRFPPGRCVQTNFAKATALVAANADASFDVVFRRSYADYLRGWIADAGREYGFLRGSLGTDHPTRRQRQPAQDDD
ncbi:MAG: sarcosine oxidase subunit gamma [Pseudomonadales bacterium]|nr:sarcosine oxidase subunit gamma [Pseudomonadales bacterium]